MLLMDFETLQEFSLYPGVIRENVTTTDVAVNDLAAGQRLRVGGALFEVTCPCEPCERMDEIRMGLQELLQGKRGTLCRVIEGGLVRRGDSIEIIPTSVASHGVKEDF